MTALAAPLIAAAGAFGTETAYWYYRDIQLQAAADAAAYTGALVRRMGSDTEQVTAAVTDTATKNGFETSVGEVTVNIPPTLGAHITNKAVEVFLEEHRKRIFTAIFMDGDVPIGARAVAIYQDASSACVLALHNSKSKAALFSGTSNAKFTNCSVMSNSIANDSLTVQGSAKLNASCAYSAGGANTTTGVTLAECDAAQTEVAPVGDPFSDIVAPDTSGSCQGTGGSTLSPGVYCGGMTLSGHKTLAPGVYVVDGGELKINANAEITGDGVMFYLTGDARVSINGNATVNLSAATSGTYAGILFFGDRASSGGAVNKFNGTATSSLTGAIYFPTQDVQYTGNFSGAGGCTHVVGSTVEWSGNTSISQDCSAYGMRNIPATQIVKIVE